MVVINFIVYHITMFMLIILSNILYPHKVIGRKNIPKDIPYILYGNHISFVDAVFLKCIFRRRRVFFMGKEELFKKPILNWYFGLNGGFPVKRGTPDMKAIKKCIGHLKDGDVMMIFPEGTRNPVVGGELQEFHNGASIIMLQTKVDALPVYIESKKGLKIFTFSKVHIGELIDMSEYNSTKMSTASLDRSGEKLKSELQKLKDNC